MKWVKGIGLTLCFCLGVYALWGVATTELSTKQTYMDMIRYQAYFILAGGGAVIFYNIYAVTKHTVAVLVCVGTLLGAICKALILAIKETHQIRQRAGSYTSIYGNCCSKFDSKYKPKHKTSKGKYLGGKH